MDSNGVIHKLKTTDPLHPSPCNAVLAVLYPPPSPILEIGLRLWFGRRYATYLPAPGGSPVTALGIEHWRIISICCVLDKRLC